MIPARYILLFSAMLVVLNLGCNIKSKYRTGSTMTEEQRQSIRDQYYPEPEIITEKPPFEPMLIGYEGVAISVAGQEIDASEIRDLYDYLTSFRYEDPDILKHKVCNQLIAVNVIMSQYPDAVSVARDELLRIRDDVADGADFVEFILDRNNSNGDIGPKTRNEINVIYGMHAFSGTVGELIGPFATEDGYELIEILERNDDDPDNPIVHTRRLFFAHDRSAAEDDKFNEGNFRNWMRQAMEEGKIDIVAEELIPLLPEFAHFKFPVEPILPEEIAVDISDEKEISVEGTPEEGAPVDESPVNTPELPEEPVDNTTGD